MTTSLKYRCALVIGLVVGFVQIAGRLTAQTQSDDRPWILNAGHLQSVGLHLPSNMPTMRDLVNYQRYLPTHQELQIDWDPHTGFDHPAWRELVAEDSLKHEFALVERKQNVKGNAVMNGLTLNDLGLEVVAITANGEVRGFANGPSLLMRGESLPAGNAPRSVPHDYIMGKGPFRVSLPDDPQITNIALLLVHPDGGKFRLEQIGTIDLTTKEIPK
jgi:hypothetical protein